MSKQKDKKMNDSDEVQDWADESKNADQDQDSQDQEKREFANSVIYFDRDEVAALENKTVKDLSTEDLIKVGIIRGEQQKNPVVAGELKKLLKKINGERIRRRTGPPRFNKFRNFNGPPQRNFNGPRFNNQNYDSRRDNDETNRNGFNNNGFNNNGFNNKRYNNNNNNNRRYNNNNRYKKNNHENDEDGQEMNSHLSS